jgi:hypothetical protein
MVAQHWFRHRLATLMLRRDPRATMEQGGWLDIRSVIGYSHDKRGPFGESLHARSVLQG